MGRAERDIPGDIGTADRDDADLGPQPFGIEPQGNERILFDATLAATDLVFVVPLYWYSVPASAKLYLDYWSGWLRVPGADFKPRMAGRTLWGVSVLSEEDQTRADPLIGTLAITADYMKMKFGGVLLGYGSRPGDVITDKTALEKARTFFAAKPGLTPDLQGEMPPSLAHSG